MARLRGRGRVLSRLLALQAAWSYDRMQGIGVGWASEPALRATLDGDETRYREALARASLFFNANPYLAPIAVGAGVRAEAERVPGPQIERLRTALCGPLGALGDRIFWAGIVPALGAGAAIAVTLGAGPWPALVAVVVYNAFRLAIGPWLLDLGWSHGLRVGAAIGASPLPALGERAVRAAAALGTAVVPVAGAWLLQGASRGELLAAAGFVLAALLLRLLLGPRASARRLTLIGAALVVAWHLLVPD